MLTPFSAVIYLLIASTAAQVRIAVYYSSECPYSKRFMQQQLKPSYNQVKNSVNITFVPFGKAYSIKSGTSVSFKCQHGQRECDGNVFELCALKLIGNDQDRQIAFVTCDMNFSRSHEQCAKNVGLNVIDIYLCINRDGTALQLAAEQVTAPILKQSRHVPTVVFNGRYHAGEDEEAHFNFLFYVKLLIREMDYRMRRRTSIKRCKQIH